MQFFRRSKARFAAVVATPVVLILVLSIVFIFLALREMAVEVDRSDAVATEASVRAALNALEARLVETHGDYAVWDEAVKHLSSPVDAAFAASNYGDSTKTAVLFDAAYLLDERGGTAFAFRAGASVSRGPIDEYGQPLAALIASLDGHFGPYDAKVGLMKDHSGAIAAVAVGSIQPSSDTLPPPAGHPSLLVLVRTLDDVAVRRIGQSFVIESLRIRYDAPAAGAAPGGNRVDLVDPTGKVLGALAWSHPNRGDQALARVAPTAYLTMLMIALTVMLLLGIGYRNLLDLQNREREAVRAARRDSLTGLYNRFALIHALEAALNSGSGRTIAAIYLDLDGFKDVNDGYGHEAGDRVLQRVARGFEDIAEPLGTLARVGGDEFALIIDRPDLVAEAEEIGNRLVRFFHTPVTIDGRTVPIGTSVGIALAKAGTADAEELLRRADVAMYKAKELGRNRVAIYDPSIEAARTDRICLAGALRSAIAADQLTLVFQPIVATDGLAPSMVEASVQWRGADGAWIEPERFMAAAEENGLLEDLGEWVLRRACEAAVAWPQLRLCLDVSPLQFRHTRFDRLVAATLEQAGLPPSRLEIEITEAHLEAHSDRVQSIISSLRLIGVSVALDGFGSGTSSIGALRRFSFDRLKLDRSLVHGIGIDADTRRLCEATIMLARALDLPITAEGVETEAETALLRKLGCSHLQGAAFGHATTAAMITRRLQAEPPPSRWREGRRRV